MLKEKHLGWQVIAGSDVSEGRWPPTLQQSLVFLQSMPLVCFCFYFSQKKQSSLTRAGENIQINEEDNEIRYFVLWTVCARISLVLPFPVLCMIVNIFRVLFIVGPHLPFGVFPIFCCFWPPTVSSVFSCGLAVSEGTFTCVLFPQTPESLEANLFRPCLVSALSFLPELLTQTAYSPLALVDSFFVLLLFKSVCDSTSWSKPFRRIFLWQP